jgi:hypothetical protein
MSSLLPLGTLNARDLCFVNAAIAKARPMRSAVHFSAARFEQQIDEEILCEELLVSHGHVCQPEPLG